MRRDNFKCPTCGISLPEAKECYQCRRKKYLLSITPEKVMPDSVPRNLLKSLPEHPTEKDLKFNQELKEGGFYLWGSCGVGKSYQAALYLFFVLRSSNKYQAEWINAPKFLFTLRQLYNKKDVPEEQSEEFLLDKYSRIPYLILDDLGAEKMSEWVRQVLYLIINERYENERTTIITSNLTIRELADKIEDDHIPSRIMGMCEIVEINGKDRRIK